MGGFLPSTARALERLQIHPIHLGDHFLARPVHQDMLRPTNRSEGIFLDRRTHRLESDAAMIIAAHAAPVQQVAGNGRLASIPRILEEDPTDHAGSPAIIVLRNLDPPRRIHHVLEKNARNTTLIHAHACLSVTSPLWACPFCCLSFYRCRFRLLLFRPVRRWAELLCPSNICIRRWDPASGICSSSRASLDVDPPGNHAGFQNFPKLLLFRFHTYAPVINKVCRYVYYHNFLTYHPGGASWYRASNIEPQWLAFYLEL